MENNSIIDFDIKIQLIQAAILGIEKSCASDVLNTIKNQPESDFEISDIIDIYVAPLKRLKVQLYNLQAERSAIENENATGFFESLRRNPRRITDINSSKE